MSSTSIRPSSASTNPSSGPAKWDAAPCHPELSERSQRSRSIPCAPNGGIRMRQQPATKCHPERSERSRRIPCAVNGGTRLRQQPATKCHPERSARRARSRGIPRTPNGARRPERHSRRRCDLAPRAVRGIPGEPRGTGSPRGPNCASGDTPVDKLCIRRHVAR